MVHLADAVGELLRNQALRIHYLPAQPERHYTARAPSLLAQLAAAVASSSSGRGGRTVPDSRVPLNVGTLQLWVEIETSIHHWARELNVDRRPYLRALDADAAAADDHWRTILAPGLQVRRPELPDQQVPALGRLLRLTAAAAAAHDAIASTMTRRCWCGKDDITPADCTRGCWAHRIRALLAGNTEDREIRGVACPDCGQSSTVEERDGEPHRVPAIVIRVAEMLDAGDDDLWAYRMCRACGSEGWLDYLTDTTGAVVHRFAEDPAIAKRAELRAEAVAERRKLENRHGRPRQPDLPRI